MDILTPWINRTLGSFGEFCQRSLKGMGDFLLFNAQAFRWLFRKPFRAGVFLKQMEFIGVKSVGIVMLVAIFSGGVFALQTGYAFGLFNAEVMVGSTVAIAMCRELAPVFASLMVIARAGSAMAAELGSMVVSEQVEALSSMAINPVQYLVVPRLVAGFLMLPLLTGLFDAVGIMGAYFVGVYLLRIPEGPFLNKMDYYLDPSDVVQGLIKGAIFGFFLTSISTFQGITTRGGAEGVGRSTTQAVVYSSVTVLVMDYFLTTWILEYFPKF